MPPSDTIRLYHYGALASDPDGGLRVDPQRFGRGKHTQAEKKHAPFPPRSFFYATPDFKEHFFDGRRRYVADVPKKHLFFATGHPNPLAAMHEAHEAGYHGIYYHLGGEDGPPVVAMFRPTEVTEDQEYTPMPTPVPSKLLFARTQAPAGGMIAGNLFQKGGRFVAKPVSRVATVMARLRSRAPVRLARRKPIDPDVAAMGASVAAVPHDGVRRAALSDMLEEQDKHHSPETLHTLRAHDGPVMVFRHPESKKVHAVPTEFLTVPAIRQRMRDAGSGWWSPDNMRFFGTRATKGVHSGPGGHYFVTSEDAFRREDPREYHVRKFDPATNELTTVEHDEPGHWRHGTMATHPTLSAARAHAKRLASGGALRLARAPRPGDPSLLPFERDDLERMGTVERRAMDKHVSAALADKPGLLPTKREVTALALAGDSVAGGYADAHKLNSDLFPHGRDDAERWAALNGILSANAPWLGHTVGATNALALWHQSGRPTDRATLEKLFGGTGKRNVFFDGTKVVPHPLPEAAAGTYASRSAPPMYFTDKAQKIVRLLSVPGPFRFDPKLIAGGSYKTPNFAYAHMSPDGVPIDTHMAKLFRRHKGDGVPRGADLRKAQTLIYGRSGSQHAFKTLISETGRSMGWEPRQVQEAVWTGVLALMAAKKNAGKDEGFPEAVRTLSRRAIRAGWDMHTVFQSPVMRQALAHLGVTDKTFAAAVAASRERHPIPPVEPVTIRDHEALAGAYAHLPAQIRGANVPINEAMRAEPLRMSRHGRVGVPSSFDALLHLAILAGFGGGDEEPVRLARKRTYTYGHPLPKLFKRDDRDEGARRQARKNPELTEADQKLLGEFVAGWLGHDALGAFGDDMAERGHVAVGSILQSALGHPKGSVIVNPVGHTRGISPWFLSHAFTRHGWHHDAEDAGFARHMDLYAQHPDTKEFHHVHVIAPSNPQHLLDYVNHAGSHHDVDETRKHLKAGTLRGWHQGDS